MSRGRGEAMIEHDSGESPDSLVRNAIARWRAGEQPNADEFLQAHPEVRERKSLAIDLIYEEYCLRQEHGETFVASTFCQRFPAYKQSLARMLDVHQFMALGGTDLAPAWPKIGDVFLGFEIVEQIGAGAVAKVYLAREVEVGGRLVVVKVSQFGRGEARLLGKLTHPGVVPIHSVRDDPLSGMTCICMPFLGTATLVDVLDEAFTLGAAPSSGGVVATVAPGYLPKGIDPAAWRPLDPFFQSATYEEGIVHLGRQIVAALAKAHAAGITHRDIKPSNVLLSRDGRPMLLDFNLATDERLPPERIGGTLAYMAPERIEALADDRVEAEPAADPRSDLYSVGAMLFELLTGQLPTHPPESAGERQPGPAQWLASRQGAPPSARSLNPRVEPALDAILMRCLSPQPGDRFGSADELLAALEPLLSPRARLGRQLRRRRRTVLAAGLGLVATAAAGTTYWLSLPPLPERLFQAGLAAYDRGEYKQAREYFTQSIEAGNDSKEVYFARGQAYRQLGDNSQNDDFAKAQFRDKTGVAAIYVGFAAGEAGRVDVAIPMYQSVQRSGWDTVSVANQLAITFVQKGMYRDGIGELDRVLTTFGDDDQIRFNRTLASALFAQTQLDPPRDKKAGADARYLIRKFPNDVEVQRLAAFLQRSTTKNAPHPPLGSDKGQLSLAPGWRKMPPPVNPRFDDSVKLLESERRLP